MDLKGIFGMALDAAGDVKVNTDATAEKDKVEHQWKKGAEHVELSDISDEIADRALRKELALEAAKEFTGEKGIILNAQSFQKYAEWRDSYKAEHGKDPSEDDAWSYFQSDESQMKEFSPGLYDQMYQVYADKTDALDMALDARSRGHESMNPDAVAMAERYDEMKGRVEEAAYAFSATDGSFFDRYVMEMEGCDRWKYIIDAVQDYALEQPKPGIVIEGKSSELTDEDKERLHDYYQMHHLEGPSKELPEGSLKEKVQGLLGKEQGLLADAYNKAKEHAKEDVPEGVTDAPEPIAEDGGHVVNGTINGLSVTEGQKPALKEMADKMMGELGKATSGLKASLGKISGLFSGSAEFSDKTAERVGRLADAGLFTEEQADSTYGNSLGE